MNYPEDSQELERVFLAAYDNYADAIFRHCFFRIYNRDDAHDLVHETYMRTWEYLMKGNGIENLRAFLYRVANNLIIDRSRKKKALSLDELQEQGFDPKNADHESMGNRVLVGDVLASLERLDEKYQRVILLRFVDDLTPREIAEILKESENAVSVRLHRALKKARKLFEDKKI